MFLVTLRKVSTSFPFFQLLLVVIMEKAECKSVALFSSKKVGAPPIY